MPKFLSCGLFAALALVSTALQVCAEPPPAEPVVISTGGTNAPTCVQCLPTNWK